jgi:hypothetical protein
MRPNIPSFAIAILCVSILLPGYNYAADAKKISLERLVAHAIWPLMRRYGVPGIAVGILVKGQPHVYSYGSASAATGRAVTSDTLFETGLISKTFTAFGWNGRVSRAPGSRMRWRGVDTMRRHAPGPAVPLRDSTRVHHKCQKDCLSL